ncbi:MAG: enoyl-CoA hydratase, partial [Gammaproteobacteria bacterium]
LGGGMEAAISSNVIIAERSAQMGLPEILFNMFPGMGAYSFLSRQVGPKMAERIILSGDTFSAEQLYEMGVVDIVCDDGEGIAAVHNFVKRQKRMGNSTTAMQKVARRVNPVPYQELIDITEIWADAALKLTEKDLKKMDRLVRAQNKLNTTLRPVVNVQHVA